MRLNFVNILKFIQISIINNLNNSQYKYPTT